MFISKKEREELEERIELLKRRLWALETRRTSPPPATDVARLRVSELAHKFDVLLNHLKLEFFTIPAAPPRDVIVEKED